MHGPEQLMVAVPSLGCVSIGRMEDSHTRGRLSFSMLFQKSFGIFPVEFRETSKEERVDLKT